MESNLLELAKKYEKRGEWNQSIKCYEQYLNDSIEQCSEILYASYVKALRSFGETKKAEEVLAIAKNIYSESELLLIEEYYLCDSTGNWTLAINVAENLLEINPQKSDHYFKLGKAYAVLLKKTKAEEAYINGLKIKHGMSFEQLAKKIKQGFTNNPDEYVTEYSFINGSNNMGALIHESESKQYFTKIAVYDRSAKRENAFLKDIRPNFESLKSITPAHIDSQIIDKLLYLTVEMIEGPDVNSKQENIQNIINVTQQISKVRYYDIIKDYPNPNYLFQMRNRPNSIVIFFTKIHEKEYNEKLFTSLYKLIKQNNYSTSIKKIIERLETQIMKNNLYIFIHPKIHYSLLHGDFIPKNMKTKNTDNSVQVFDWGPFTTGPHFINIARYLSSSLFPYAQIKSEYLWHKEFGGKLTIIEKIFFLYALILLYLLRVKEENADKYLDEYMLPALEDLEILVEKFFESEFKSSLETIAVEKESNLKTEQLEHEIDVLKKENSTIKKENNKLDEQLTNILNSKSWKVTKPLRILIQKF